MRGEVTLRQFIGDTDILYSIFSQREIKRSAVTNFARGPDAAAVARDDPLNAGEAHAGAGKFRRTVQALEDAKKFRDVAHVEADAVVLDKKGGRFLCGARAVADLDARGGVFPRVLHRVIDQVEPHLSEHRGIGADLRER